MTSGRGSGPDSGGNRCSMKELNFPKGKSQKMRRLPSHGNSSVSITAFKWIFRCKTPLPAPSGPLSIPLSPHPSMSLTPSTMYKVHL